MNAALKQVINEARLYADVGQPHAGRRLLERAREAIADDGTMAREAERLTPRKEPRLQRWTTRAVDALYIPAIVVSCAITAVLLYGILFI
jgi:hypothetical protein